MKSTLIDRIDKRLEALGITERSASLDATGKPDTIRNIRRGKEPGAEKVIALARVLQCPVEWLLAGEGPLPGPVTGPPAVMTPNVVFAPEVRVPVASEMPRDLPVRGIAACSSGDGAFQVGADVVDWVRRPPLFNGVPEAYALYMSGDSMEPRLFHGDLVMVHPFRPVRPGDLAIFVLKDAADEPEYSFCKVFQSDRGGIVTVEQYNPRMTREFPRDRIIARHRVMELRDLFGA
jgi:phage repressor protein C with HTH and peptisase S24 domain